MGLLEVLTIKDILISRIVGGFSFRFRFKGVTIVLGLIKIGGLWLEIFGFCFFSFDSMINFFFRLRVLTFAEKIVFFVVCEFGGIVRVFT